MHEPVHEGNANNIVRHERSNWTHRRIALHRMGSVCASFSAVVLPRGDAGAGHERSQAIQDFWICSVAGGTDTACWSLSWMAGFMKGTPNKPDSPNAAITSLFQGGYHWRGIGDPECWTSRNCGRHISSFASFRFWFWPPHHLRFGAIGKSMASAAGATNCTPQRGQLLRGGRWIISEADICVFTRSAAKARRVSTPANERWAIRNLDP